MLNRTLRIPQQSSAFSESLTESGTWLNGLWQSVSCPHPTTYMLCILGQSHLQLLHESSGTKFLEIFERITSYEYKDFTPLWSVVSIFHQNIFVWKTCWSTYIFPWHIQKNMWKNFSVVKLIRELSNSWGSSLQRQRLAEQEMQYFVEFALGARIAFSRLVRP